MPARLSRRPLGAMALLVAAVVLVAVALAPRRTLLAATDPGTLPRPAANLRPVAALPVYRAPAPPARKHPSRRLERPVTSAATPSPARAIAAPPAPTATPQPVATPAPAPQAAATPAPAPVGREVSAAPPRPVPAAPSPAPTFDSSGGFDSSG
jgi:hypothetical protein